MFSPTELYEDISLWGLRCVECRERDYWWFPSKELTSVIRAESAVVAVTSIFYSWSAGKRHLIASPTSHDEEFPVSPPESNKCCYRWAGSQRPALKCPKEKCPRTKYLRSKCAGYFPFGSESSGKENSRKEIQKCFSVQKLDQIFLVTFSSMWNWVLPAL